MITNDFIQMKLVNGDEIVCEVVEWDDEESTTIVIRKALKITSITKKDGYGYYSFKPWMLHVDNPATLLTLNGDHVVGSGMPASALMDQYMRVIAEYQNNYDEEVEDKDPMNLDLVVDIGEAMMQVMQVLRGDSDSPPSNIVRFKSNKDKMN